VRVPKPYNFHEGVLLMELVADEPTANAAPRLNDLWNSRRNRPRHSTTR
jgi:RIO kinase 1